MLTNTFCHVPGISVKEEQRLWSAGVHSWEMVGQLSAKLLPRIKSSSLAKAIEESFRRLEANDPNYFSNLLSSSQHWRMFPDFRHRLAFLDIETTGLAYQDEITTIAIYDGRSIRHYVNGVNLEDFKRDIRDYSLIVTYNGKSFDAPFIEKFFRMRLDHAHIDLRYILKDLGYTGGLKACERRLGVDRGGLEDVDGYFAVLLWQDYRRNKNAKSLETLLAYNIEDVLNLETLLVKAYNMNLKGTPFSQSLRLELLPRPASPFGADRETIRRIRREHPWIARRY
ncbi:MAG: ribonuclease H-like domain-containing protein [Acidobacteriota bacterium]